MLDKGEDLTILNPVHLASCAAFYINQVSPLPSTQSLRWGSVPVCFTCLEPEGVPVTLSLSPPSLQEDEDKLTCLFLSLDFWEYYLPYLYSCISFLGVLLLLGEYRVWEGKRAPWPPAVRVEGEGLGKGWEGVKDLRSD